MWFPGGSLLCNYVDVFGSTGWMDVCRQTFPNHYSYSFRLILTKVGTHDLCANIKPNCRTDFQKFALNFFGKL